MASFLAAHHGNCKDNQTTGHATELPRLRKSCDYCVRMKRGCDGGTPCELCRRRNKHCIRSLKKRSGPAKGAKYRKRGNHHLALSRSNAEPVTKAAAAAATSSITKIRTRAPCRPTLDQDSFTRGGRFCGGAGSNALVSDPTDARYTRGEPAALEKYHRASVPVSPVRVLSQPPRPTSQLVTPLMSKKPKEVKKQEVSSSAFGASLQSSWRGTCLEETVWDCRSVRHDIVGSKGNFPPLSYSADGAARTGPDTVPGGLRATGEGPSMFGGGGGDWNASVEVAEWNRGSLEEVLLGSYCKRSNSSGKSQVHMSAITRAPEYPQFVPPSTVTSSMRSGPENVSGVGLADLQTTVLPPKENRLGTWESSPSPSLGELLLGEATTCGLC